MIALLVVSSATVIWIARWAIVMIVNLRVSNLRVR